MRRTKGTILKLDKGKKPRILTRKKSDMSKMIHTYYIHPLDKCSLNTYHVPGSVLGNMDYTGEKTDINL